MHDQPPTDIEVGRLRRQLAAEQAINDSLTADLARAQAQSAHPDIPEELEDALRHGHAHEPVRLQTGGVTVTAVLTHDGTGTAHPRREYRIWQAIVDAVDDALAAAPPAGVDYLSAQRLPEDVESLIVYEAGRAIVITNTAARRRRRHLLAALRAAGPVAGIAIVAGTVVRRLVQAAHMSIPVVTVGAVSTLAVTSIVTASPDVSDRHGDRRTADQRYAGPPARPRLGGAATPKPETLREPGGSPPPAVVITPSPSPLPSGPPAPAPSPSPVPTPVPEPASGAGAGSASAATSEPSSDPTVAAESASPSPTPSPSGAKGRSGHRRHHVRHHRHRHHRHKCLLPWLLRFGCKN